MRRRNEIDVMPQRIYLFGSKARGDPGADSDYDLAVIVPEIRRRPVPAERGARQEDRCRGPAGCQSS
jgi:predicted nucleotidyltransferase